MIIKTKYSYGYWLKVSPKIKTTYIFSKKELGSSNTRITGNIIPMPNTSRNIATNNKKTSRIICFFCL